MPVYEYEHIEKSCKLGKVFEWEQSIKEDALTSCPECGSPVKRLISAPTLSFPKTNSDLKNMGFTKLVRRDHGVYENVTASEKESKVTDLRDQSTYPDFKSKIGD
jgi:putative FmdB family regulatory protein